MHFKPRTFSEAVHAIGDTQGLPLIIQQALNPGTDFKLIPVPKPGDWLFEHPEAGQSFNDFVKAAPNEPDILQKKICLQPLGVFPEGRSPSLKMLHAYAGAFFGMEVNILSAVDIRRAELKTRINPVSENRQILTTDILMFLKKRVPVDAFCVLAITMEDLYPDPSWNFVFGQASLSDRVGVFSFSRYDPAFYGEKRGKDYLPVLLRRSCKVLAHEISHMFSMGHCIYFHCLMNGSNHLRESDARPLFLCPVCLRKLWFIIGFDAVDRYRHLLSFYRMSGLYPEHQWILKRLHMILENRHGK